MTPDASSPMEFNSYGPKTPTRRTVTFTGQESARSSIKNMNVDLERGATSCMKIDI